MSKNISIQEGGVAKQLSVDKLQTDLVGGGSQLWVPEDEVHLTTKHISENGTYRASDDGYYGYSEVTVNGVGVARGKDSNGNAAVAYTDPSTGDLVMETVPSSIRVITIPTDKSGVYQDGDTITKTGMVVKAYLESGAEYDVTGYPNGVIPNEELAISPMTAVYNPDLDPGDHMEATDESIQNVQPPQPIPYGSSVKGRWEEYKEIPVSGGTIRMLTWEEITYSAPCVTGWFADTRGTHFLYASASPFTLTVTTKSFDGLEEHSSTVTRSIDVLSHYNDRPIYYGSSTGGKYTDLSIDAGAGAKYGDSDDKKVAYIMLYGETESVPGGSPQTIKVSWPVPHGGYELETNFEITVQEA